MIGAAQGSRLASFRPLTGGDELMFTATLDTEVTRLFITNVSGGAAAFRLYHVVAGGTPAQANALFFDHVLAANDTFELLADAPNSGIQLKTDDMLYVRAAVGGTVAFNVYGVTASIAPGLNT